MPTGVRVGEIFLWPQTHREVDHYIQLEEQGISDAQLRIIRLRMHRNMLSPICRIPLELLSQIFVALARAYAEDYYLHYDHTSWPQKHWIVITAVCRHWRDVAFRTPRMWSYALLRQRDSLDVLSTFMKLSGHTSLMVVQPMLDWRNVLHPQILQSSKIDLLMSQFHRIQDLTFVLCSLWLKTSEQLPGSFDAPMLHTLNVGVSETVPNTRTTFPTVANAYWPKLSSLQCILGSFALVQALTRPTLTVLSVNNLTAPQPAIAWVDFLKGLPCLEELTIAAGLSELGIPINIIPQPTQTVILPNLKYLSLGDAGVGTASADFLNHLIIPVGVRKNLRTSHGGTEEELRFVLSAYAAKALGHGVIGRVHEPPRVLSLEPRPLEVCIYVYTKDVRVSGGVNDPWDMGTTSSVRGVEEEAFMIKGPNERVVRMFLSLYPVQQVHGIRVDMVDLRDDSTWRMIANLPNLVEMYFTYADTSVATLLGVLPQAVSFPKLKTLIFNAVTWNKAHSGLKKRRRHEGSLLPALVRAMRVRFERGQGLKRLELPWSSNIESQYRCHEFFAQLRGLLWTSSNTDTIQMVQK